MLQQPGFTGGAHEPLPLLCQDLWDPTEITALGETNSAVSWWGFSSIVLMMSTSLLKIMLSTTLTWRNQMDHITHRQGPVQIANAENLHQVTRLEFFTKTATEKATKV